MSLWTSVLEFPINHNSSYPIGCATEFLSSQEERNYQQHVASLNVESGGGRPFTVRSQPRQVALHVLFHFTEEQPVWEKKKKKKYIKILVPQAYPTEYWTAWFCLSGCRCCGGRIAVHVLLCLMPVDFPGASQEHLYYCAFIKQLTTRSDFPSPVQENRSSTHI